MPTHDPWDGTEWAITAPDIDQPYGNAYKEIYDLRKGVAIRMNKEHETLAASSAGGVHKQGTARMWHLATASIPALQPDGATALDSGDNGMLWHDITTDIVYVLDDYANPTVDGGWVAIGNYLGNIAINTNKFTVARATGNTVIAGTLGVTGISTFTGAITANGGITLGAGDDLIGSATSDITINTNKFTVAGATGNVSVGGTFESVGVATLADTSVTKTTAAPTADAQLANKKYVDDQVDTKNFGAYTREDDETNNMVKAHAYLANQDGVVSAWVVTTGIQYLRLYIGDTTDPAGAGDLIVEVEGTVSGHSVAVPAIRVASGKYFEITTDSTNEPAIYWHPTGTLVKPTDQN